MSKSKYDSKHDDDDDQPSSLLPAWANINFAELEVGERIGGGGVGVIYKGWWKNQQVAMKTLFDSRIGQDLKQEYMDELLVMSKVKHSNIVSFLGACMVPPNLCFVMELCDCSVFQLLHVDKVSFSPQDNIQLAIDVGSAMEYLHSLSPAIIHRDLKTLNILRAANGSFKVCDFGLVKVKSATAGTPAYMAPELIDNRPFNKSVDVYAFGVVLWEIYAAEIPFYGIDITEIRQRVVAGGRPRIPSYGFSSRLSGLIGRCWEQRADGRPSFTDVVDTLYEIEKEAPAGKHSDNVNDNAGDALDDIMGFGRK